MWLPFEPSGSEFFCTESGVSESFLYVVTSTSSRYTTRYVYDACQWRLVSGGHSQRHRAPAQGTPLQICRQVATNAVRAGINTRRTKVKQTNNYKDNAEGRRRARPRRGEPRPRASVPRGFRDKVHTSAAATHSRGHSTPPQTKSATNGQTEHGAHTAGQHGQEHKHETSAASSTCNAT